MSSRLRLLPVLILIAGLVCVFKLEDVWKGFQALGPTGAVAQEAPAKKALAKAKTESKTGTEKEDGTASSGGDGETAKPATKAAAIDPATLTASEVAVLQALAGRRQRLDALRRDLDVREGVLKATENQIDEKIARLKKIEVRISEFVEGQEEHREEQLKSLVKVYESMKPKHAARILDRLDIEVLLEVTGRMREVKMAAILARMTPARAEELTLRLVKRRHLPDVEG